MVESILSIYEVQSLNIKNKIKLTPKTAAYLLNCLSMGYEFREFLELFSVSQSSLRKNFKFIVHVNYCYKPTQKTWRCRRPWHPTVHYQSKLLCANSRHSLTNVNPWAWQITQPLQIHILLKRNWPGTVAPSMC